MLHFRDGAAFPSARLSDGRLTVCESKKIEVWAERRGPSLPRAWKGGFQRSPGRPGRPGLGILPLKASREAPPAPLLSCEPHMDHMLPGGHELSGLSAAGMLQAGLRAR